MKTQKMRIWIVIITALACVQTLSAQQTGYPPFGSFQVGNFDGVNLQDLNVTFSLPVIASSGRGINFQLPIVYNSLVWNKYSTVWSPNFGWQTNLPQGQSLGGQYFYLQFKCYNPGPGWTWGHRYKYGGYAFVDPAGTVHSFPIAITTDDCWGDSGTYSGYASDASGYYGSVDANFVLHVTGPSGTAPGSSSIIDANGNYITQTVNGNETDYTDSVGRKAAKVITNTTSIQYEFLDGTGTNTYKTATLTLTSESIKTNFACGGVTEYIGSAYLPTELDMPTPSGATLRYIFTYEPTPGSPSTTTGRLQKVTLPTGGTYEYDYGATNDGVSCTDGSVINMTRKVTDGSTVGTWQYSRVVTGNPAVWQNTVTDAAGNDTVYTFGYPTGPETKRQLYSGTGGSRTIQRTLNTTWASNGTPATSVTILEDNSTQSEADTTFDSNGLLDSETEYDWGAGTHGAAIRTTTLSYLNSSNYTSRNIIDHVQTKIVRSGGATGTIQNRQDITYDGATITSCPTGVAQHDDTHFGCSMNYRGNPTSVTTWLDPVTPGQPLTTTLTYDVFGNVLQASGGGAPQTQSSFSSTTQYAEPDSTSVGGLTAYFTYYSDTGQLKTAKDPNNQQTSYAYDFLRRSTSVTRPDNFQVTTAYNDSAFTTNVTSPIDGSRSVQQITAFDAQGLPYTQTVEDSNNTVYSIVQTNYDAMGRAYRTSNPYTGSPSSWTTTSFDALSRVSSLTDPGSGTLSFTYTLNDVLQILGPKPSGENTKNRQMEYDAAGRLTSVCEVTTLLFGYGNCSQKSARNGYWTTYVYNVLDELTNVTQNAQSSTTQTRTYAYDALGRMTSETNPESGARAYYYDVIPTGCYGAGGSSPGDLTATRDNAGNFVCNQYDSVHRVFRVGTPTGCKSFSYDNSQGVQGSRPTGVTINNGMGRLVQAETDNCSAWPPVAITDEWFSYTPLGQTSDAYESTPHSGGYYHVAEAYWANGVRSQLSSLAGSPTINYGVDPVGRLGTVSASSGQNPVSSTTYNAASMPTAVNFGSGDNDTFTYDPSGRMSKYQYSVRSQSEVGTLTWNPNGTLGSLGITDPFASSDTQTCNYTHDDLVRIASANCGSIWSQTFSFDAFGNINKAGNSSFGATYSPATNRMTTIGTSTPSYDANGNVTNDFLHTYTWDANDRPVTTIDTSGNTSGATYDALGRNVEHSWNGTYYYPFVYAPTGEKVGRMSGQTLTWEWVPLPGGATAIYTSGGLYHYRHTDWLGSVRLTTTPSQTVDGDVALAPYGETYAQSGSPDFSFTGMEQSSAYNEYDFPAREYGIQGRWPSPDPAGLAAVDLSNPQSLNRYAYVLNNPLSLVDPTGLYAAPSPPPPPPPLPDPIYFGDDPWFDGNGAPNGGVCIKIHRYLLGDSLSQAQEACGVSPPSPATMNGTSQTQSKVCTQRGLGVGASLGANADIGVIKAGAAVTGSAGGGVFGSSGNGLSSGGYATGGAAAYAGRHSAGVPAQNGTSVFGAFAGAGASVFVTNAGSVQQLYGNFSTLNFNVGYSFAQLQISWASGNGVWMLSASGPKMGAGYGFSNTTLNTNTVTTKGGC